MVISKEKQKALYFPLTFQKQLFEKRKGELEDAHKKGLYKTKEDADYIISRFWDVISENGTKYYLFRQSAIDIANRLKFDHKKFDASFLSVIPNGKKVTFLMGDVFFRWHKNENDIVVMGCAYDKIDPKRKEVDVKWYFFTINLVEDAYSYPPNAEPPFTENTWIDFMKLILFTELSELEIVTLGPKQITGSKKDKEGKIRNDSDSNIVIVDSSWNKILIRDGFLVSGHPKLQPHGTGNKLRKYIWIDTYAKEGYVRNPKMLVEEEKLEKENTQ